jgi:ketosteroid isomerase-like protein
MSSHETIKRYYDCFRERDKEGLRRLLTSDFHHVSSFGEHTDRDEMIEAIWPRVGTSWAEDIQIVGEHPDFMVHFTTVSQDRRAMRMAEWIHFREERIAAIEVFTGRELADG